MPGPPRLPPDDAAVTEAIKLTKQAVEYATTGRW
jgi:hypothetical protein